jgi:hypothetical protein
MPTENPLMKRPATSIPIFCDAQTMIDPMHHITAPTWIARLRPNLSEMNPEAKAPMKEPPGMAAVIPPCTEELGPEHCGGPFGPSLK